MNRRFNYIRPIRWGDTDAAGIVFTAHYFDMCMEAIEAWFKQVIGEDWYTMNLESNIGTPFVHSELDFSSPMTPKDVLSIIVEVHRIGNSSLGFSVKGEKSESEKSVFNGKFTCCFCNMDNFQPIEIPEMIKTKINIYNKSVHNT